VTLPLASIPIEKGPERWTVQDQGAIQSLDQGEQIAVTDGHTLLPKRSLTNLSQGGLAVEMADDPEIPLKR
jgi:hypothetical protein